MPLCGVPVLPIVCTTRVREAWLEPVLVQELASFGIQNLVCGGRLGVQC